MLGIVDVNQQAEARARAARQANLWVDGDVVALIRTGRRTLVAAPGVRVAAPPALSARRRRSGRRLAIALVLRQAFFVARCNRQTLEDACRAHDRRAGRRSQRDLDHLEAEPRGIRIVDAAV